MGEIMTVELPKPKICGCCGLLHTHVGEGFIQCSAGGYWWNCECKSTMTYFTVEAAKKYMKGKTK
jgi:hypothetical protein